MKKIIIAGFVFAFVILGIMTFVFDFMTVRNVVDIIAEDPYPLQWASVVAAMFCVGGFVLISQVAEQVEVSSEVKDVLTSERITNMKDRIKKSYNAKINWWTSFKHGLNHNLEELGHVLRILH